MSACEVTYLPRHHPGAASASPPDSPGCPPRHLQAQCRYVMKATLCFILVWSWSIIIYDKITFPSNIFYVLWIIFLTRWLFYNDEDIFKKTLFVHVCARLYGGASYLVLLAPWGRRPSHHTADEAGLPCPLQRRDLHDMSTEKQVTFNSVTGSGCVAILLTFRFKRKCVNSNAVEYLSL